MTVADLPNASCLSTHLVNVHICTCLIQMCQHIYHDQPGKCVDRPDAVKNVFGKCGKCVDRPVADLP